MTTTLYGIRNCDRVRAARAWLDARGATYAFHDFRVEGLSAATLRRWCAAVGWEALLNRRSATWRTLARAERALDGPAGAVALMRAHPLLVRRPVLEVGDAIAVGFRADAWRRLVERAQ